MQKIRHLIPMWFEMDAQPRHISWLREFIPTYFKSIGVEVSSRDRMKVTLALVEAFDNVMRHAYPKLRRKPVLIGLCLRGRKLHVDVLDQGKGLLSGKYRLPAVESESGRGLYLMHRLAKIQSARKNGWHHLHMSISIGK